MKRFIYWFFEDKELIRQHEELMDFVLSENKGVIENFLKENNVKVQDNK
jgi:hypothetical protein